VNSAVRAALKEETTASILTRRGLSVKLVASIPK
jgi:hypothetical protein